MLLYIFFNVLIGFRNYLKIYGFAIVCNFQIYFVDMNSTMKSFKTSDSSQAVFPNSTPESLFQKLSVTNWVLIFTSAFVVVSVAIGCVIFVRNKAER